MVDVILDPFHRQLHRELSETIRDKSEALANGSANLIAEDNRTVAEKYAETVGYIRALNDVLGLCKSIEGEQMGAAARPAAVKVVNR